MYHYWNETKTNCITVNESSIIDFDSKQYLMEHDFVIPWELLIQMKIVRLKFQRKLHLQF